VLKLFCDPPFVTDKTARRHDDVLAELQRPFCFEDFFMNYSHHKHLPHRAAQIAIVTATVLVLVATAVLFSTLLFYSYP
jgi:hypothetical protein